MVKASEFTIYPAIDLRQGKVVRLKQGDPQRQTVYGDDPAATARRWLEAGAHWLHVVNLDGAFGEADTANRQALAEIIKTASGYDANVQFGGGMRSLLDVAKALEMGIGRAVLGTLAVEQPELLKEGLERFGVQHLAAGLDARDGLVRVRGWAEGTNLRAVDLAQQMAKLGLRWLIFTDVARDGVGSGLNLASTLELARSSGLNVIASGGVDSLEDIHRARQSGLPGVIVGRALYEGKIDPAELFTRRAPT
jgi:phosphoribosylformimino-5-aminoimidazole carboxamide ribotide isomerase